MKDSLLFMKEDCFTYLIPSSPENAMIYKKYGFSFVADKCVEVGKVNDEISVRQATKADANRLALFAGKCVAERYGIYITKDDVYFEETLEKLKVENGFIQVYEDGKKIVGYRTGFEDEAIEVLYDQTVDKDCVCKKKSGGKPYIMARILNIEKMVSMLSVDCGDGGTDSEQQRELIIRITDPVIEENNGLYQLNCDAGQISLKKIKQDNKKIDMTVDIGQFTAHMMGYRLIEGIPKMSVREGVFINDYL